MGLIEEGLIMARAEIAEAEVMRALEDEREDAYIRDRRWVEDELEPLGEQGVIE